MRILVCVKRVPAPGAKIAITDDAQQVDTAYLAFTTSPHEECALEAGVELVEAQGGDVTVLTLGPAEAEEQLRYAASVGATQTVLVPIEDHDWDPQRTAAALAEAITKLEAEGGPFDLLLFGNESANSGNYQVGIRVAHALGRPMVNGIKALEIDGDTAVARRESDAGLEEYRVPMPAALGIKEGINLPRYPTMKGRLASKKAVIEEVPVDAAAGGQQMERLVEPPVEVSETVILGNGPDAAPAVVDLLIELGVVSGANS